MTDKLWTCDSCGTDNVIKGYENLPENMYVGCTGCALGASIGLTPDQIKIARTLDREKIYRIDESIRALSHYAEQYIDNDETVARIHKSNDELLSWLPDFKVIKS